MELDWIEDFLVLAATRNFSRAAESRGVTQPAFSRRIRMLETWVGAPLVERRPRASLLTPAGEQFRLRAEPIARDLRQARREALEAAGRATRSLTIAATHALSLTFFPRWARETIAADEAGALHLLSDSMEACEQMMLAGEASFLLCHRHAAAPGRLAPRQFPHLVVGADRLAPFCAPDGRGAPRWRVGEAATPFLAYAAPSGFGRILEADWRARGLAFDLRQTLTARLAAALLRLAEDGRGVAWLPRSLAADSLARGVLVPAGAQDCETEVEIVLRRPAARLPAAAERLWARLAQGGP